MSCRTFSRFLNLSRPLVIMSEECRYQQVLFVEQMVLVGLLIHVGLLW